MRAMRAGALLLLLMGLGTLTLSAAADRPPDRFLPFKDLRVGMEGIGRTTVGGDRVRLFQVRIVGLVDNPGELNDYILVRASGDLIREAGGYAQGMSGSPIYIDNRLIGGFFAAFLYDESPNPIGLVRPIETMLRLVDPIRQAAETARLPTEEGLEYVEIDGQRRRVEFVSRPPSLAERRENPEVIYAVPLGTPLWVSGLTGRALKSLRQGVEANLLQRYAGALLPLEPALRASEPGAGAELRFLDEMQRGLEERYGSPIYPFAATTGAPGELPGELAPGRPMAALLTNGDITLGGVCTTTYLDPETDVLLACGHQLFLTGSASLFLAKARVIDTVNSGPISFVLPQVDRDEILGTVLQDRIQAIGASLAARPRTIKLTARIQDVSTDTVQDLSVNLADAPNFVAFLVFSSLLQGVDSAINRIGPGTMRVEYTIRGANLPRRLLRSDVFTSFSDVALFGPLQVAQVVFLLQQNPFQDPQLEWIDVDIVITEPVRLLQIVDLETDKETYAPGETVEYTIRLRPYRGEERTISGTFSLPEDLSARRLTLYVYGGPRRQQQNNQAQNVQYESLPELLEAIEELTTNDQITFQVLGLPRPPDADDEEAQADDPTQEIHKLRDWVVTGEVRTSIRIEKPAPTPPEDPAPAPAPEPDPTPDPEAPEAPSEGAPEPEEGEPDGDEAPGEEDPEDENETENEDDESDDTAPLN